MTKFYSPKSAAEMDDAVREMFQTFVETPSLEDRLVEAKKQLWLLATEVRDLCCSEGKYSTEKSKEFAHLFYVIPENIDKVAERL